MSGYFIGMTTVRRENNFKHLLDTLESLKQSGMFETQLFKESQFNLFDSGSESIEELKALPCPTKLHLTNKRLNGHQNFTRVLQQFVKSDYDKLLYLQDDLEVSTKFFTTVDYYVRTYSDKYRIFSFYTPYHEVEHAYKKKEKFWNYPARCFYGILSVVINKEDAKSFLAYMDSVNFRDKIFDISFQEWMVQKEITVCACVPNIVQHTGIVSAISKRPERKCPCFVKEYFME